MPEWIAVAATVLALAAGLWVCVSFFAAMFTGDIVDAMGIALVFVVGAGAVVGILSMLAWAVVWVWGMVPS